MNALEQLSRDTILAVVARARAAQLSPVLIDVLLDPAEPEVARLRAFGMLTAALANGTRQSPTTRTTRWLRPAA